MDALRKAEQQKQQMEGVEPGLSAGLQLEPISAPLEPGPTATPEATAAKPPASALPDLPSHMEDLDEQFLSHHAQQPTTKPAPSPPLSQPSPAKPQPVKRNGGDSKASEAARNLFEAKQAPRQPNHTFAIIVGGLTLLAAIGIGGYFWWQLQPKGAFLTAGSGLAPAQPVTPQPAPQPQASPVTAAPAAPALSPPENAVSPAPTFTAPATRPASGHAATVEPVEENEVPPRKTTPSAAARPAPASEATQSAVRLTKAQHKPDNLLEQAYLAFNRGDQAQARSLWLKKLANDPLNADALHGMAALAMQQQQTDEAASYYRRALEANPKNALALSALSSLTPQADTLRAESELKTLLADQPNSPYLNFALGNLYARQVRWPEAQQAYFKAHSSDPANPDYLFNLAISLDQLRQPRLAIQFYTQALAAAQQQNANFDPAELAKRLKILQASLLH